MKKFALLLALLFAFDVRKETQQDLAGIGGKVSRVEKETLRRYHNTTVAMMLAVPPAKEKEVSELLTE